MNRNVMEAQFAKLRAEGGLKSTEIQIKLLEDRAEAAESNARHVRNAIYYQQRMSLAQNNLLCRIHLDST